MNLAEVADLSAIAARRRRRSAIVLLVFAGVLVSAFLLAAGRGAVEIAPTRMVSILAASIGVELPWEFTRREQAVLLAIRLPRTILGVLVGAALAVSGAALQGLFRNPLADPALIGVSNGAALAAVGIIVLGTGLAGMLGPFGGPFLLPVAAFAGGLLATVFVYRIANRDGRVDVATLLLAGIAVNALAMAGVGLLVFVSTDQQLRDLSFWMLGSLGGATWAKLVPAGPLIGFAIVALLLFGRHLNALVLGESEAFHLGFRVERAKRLLVAFVALATGVSVAFTGVIGFVGLVVPHLVRLLIGPDHRMLLPVSILLGASLMLAADLVARTVVLPAELPIGILTACGGGPFFLWLLIRRRSVGSW